MVYMDELLMRIAHGMTPAVFTRRVVGGFVVSHKNRDPPYTVCGCKDTSKTCHDYFGGLERYPNTSIYMTRTLQNNFANITYHCDTASERDNVSSPNNCSDDSALCDCIPLDPGYEVDGTSADIINGLACSSTGCPCENNTDRPVASHFQSEATTATVATVWYNNRVRECVHMNVFVASQSAKPINEP